VQPSPNRRFLAVAATPTSAITVWERGRSKPLGVIQVAADDPPFTSWAPDSTTLVAVHKATVDLWRPRDGSLDRYAQLSHIGHYAPPPAVTTVAFSPDGRTVAVARENTGTATFFDARSGRRTGVFRLGPGLSMPALAYSPDGHTLAVDAAPVPRSARSSVLMLDPDTRHVRARSELPVIADRLVFLRHGTTFATVTDSETGLAELSLWDSKTLTRIGEPLDGLGNGNTMDVAPDGRRVAVGTSRGAIAWDVDPSLWVERACSIAGRTLTPEEWQRYLPGRPYDPPCRA
jgi:WD40 repeat protein